MARRNGPSGGNPQPWQTAASATPAGPPPKTPVPVFATAPSYVPPTPSIPSDAKGFQKYLNDHGAKPPLKVDGVIGPKTLAAAQTLNVAVPTSLAPPAAPPAPVAAQPVAAPAPSPPEGGGDSTPAPAPLSAQQVQEQLRVQFGYLGALLDHPDIADALSSSIEEGLSNAQALARLYDTPTWKGTQASQRNWEMLQGADPKSAEAQVDSQKTGVAAQAAKLGINIAPDRLTQIATDSIRLGWTAQQLQNAVAAEFHYQSGAQTGGLGAAEASLKALAQQYGVAKYLDDSTLASYEAQIAAGSETVDTLKQKIVGIAQSVYPGIAAQITMTNPTANALNPYRVSAATELGLAPDAIDFSDPKYSRAVNQIDDKGEHRPMSLYEWQTTLRTDPTYGWDYTKNGRDAAYEFQRSFLTAAGKIPGG